MGEVAWKLMRAFLVATTDENDEIGIFFTFLHEIVRTENSQIVAFMLH